MTDQPEQPESPQPEPQQPALRVITPGTTPEEVAAIVAVFAALGSGAPAPEQPVRHWSSAARRLGVRRPGRDAWRASALPR